MSKNFKVEELMEVELPKPNSNVSMPAYKGEPKGFVIDYIIAGCALILVPLGLIIGFSLANYRVIGILIAIMGAMGSASMFIHVELCRKIVKLVTSSECLTITALMVATKKKNREDFVKTIKGIIKDKHIAYYQLENNEKLVKVEKEVTGKVDSVVEIVEVVEGSDNKEETTD